MAYTTEYCQLPASKYDIIISLFHIPIALSTPPFIPLKPIFHYDAKTFVFGPRVGLDPQREVSRWEYQHVAIE